MALPGPAPIGVPNFFIDKFRIPPFLLPIYQAAGIEYGVRWEVLAAINEIETDYGRNLNVSTAGAVGWMQFMPSTWKRYGVDANRDGRKDPFNPVDAIFAAARYLKAAGADKDVRRAVFAYNHADWYVDSVLMRARLIGGLPADLVGSLTGLTQGHFPVHAKARYADDIDDAAIAKQRSRRARTPRCRSTSSSTRRGIDIFAKAGSPVDRRPGRQDRQDRHAPSAWASYVQLRDVYGNTYTYAHLEEALARLPGAQGEDGLQARRSARSCNAARRPIPSRPRRPPPARRSRPSAPAAAPAADAAPPTPHGAAAPRSARSGCSPTRAARPPTSAGGQEQLLDAGQRVAGFTTFKAYFTGVFGLKRNDVVLKQLKVGRKVIAGTILGRIGRTEQKIGAAHALRDPARRPGRAADRPEADPRRLEAARVHRDLPRRRARTRSSAPTPRTRRSARSC